MGSDLYISIDVRHPNDPYRNSDHWVTIFDGPSTFLARGSIVDAFGDCNSDARIAHAPGYLTHAEWTKVAMRPECPWKLDEPYWVRCIEGPEFVAIIREKRWQKPQDGDFYALECSAELRAYAAMVESLLADECEVRVWCWHSQ